MADDRMYQEALDAIRAGQHARARDLLTRLLRSDQKNANTWLYLSTVVETDKERRYCLDNALKIDPNNNAAKRGMILLGFVPPDPNMPIVRPSLGREWTIAEVLDAKGQQRSPKTQMKAIPWASLVGVLGLFAIVGALALLGIFGNPFYTPPTLASNRPTATLAPLITAGPSATPIVTAGFNVSIDFGATPTFIGPTPLAYFLEATYTPTPFYVVTDHPSSEDFTLAMTAYTRRNWESAVGYLETFIEDNPDQYDARYYLALSYYELGEYLKAANSLANIINIEPDFGPAYIARARVNLALNPLGNHADDLNRGILLAPDFIDGYLVRAEYRLLRKNFEGVIEDAQRALELNADSAVAYYYLGEASLLLEEYDEALEYASISNELDFTLLRNYYVIGHTLILTNNAAEAIYPLQTYLNYEDADPDIWLLLARADQAGGFHETALTILEHVLELDNKMVEVNYYRGLSEIELGMYPEAIESLESAIRIFPNLIDAKFQLGRAQLLDGQAATGYSTLQVNSGQARTNEQKAFLYYWRALALEALEDFENANNDWRRLLALPEDEIPVEWARTATNHIAGVYETLQPTATRDLTGTPVPTATPTGTLTVTPTTPPTLTATP